MYERGSIIQQLEERLGQSNLLEECQDFINRVIECRHQKGNDKAEEEIWVIMPMQDRWPLKQRR